MKKFILLLAFVAFAHGLKVKEGSNLKATIEGQKDACLTPPCGEVSIDNCHGSATIFIKDDGNVKDQGTLVQKRMAKASASRLSYPGLPRRSRVNKREIIIQTEGNCCWEFFSRYLTNTHLNYIIDKYALISGPKNAVP